MTERLGDSDRTRSLLFARARLRILADDLPRLVKTLKQMQAGYPSGHEGGAGQTVCDRCKGSGSFTGDLGLLEVCPECEGRGYLTNVWDDRTQSAANSPDAARRALDRIDHIVRTVRSLAEEGDSVRDSWLTPTDAQPEGEGEPGCKSCARLPDEIQGIHRSGLCRWCYDIWNNDIEIDGTVVSARGQQPPFEILVIRRVLMRNVTTKDWRDWYRTHGQHRSKRAS